MSQRSVPRLLPLPPSTVVGGLAEAHDVQRLFVSDAASNTMCPPLPQQCVPAAGAFTRAACPRIKTMQLFMLTIRFTTETLN